MSGEEQSGEWLVGFEPGLGLFTSRASSLQQFPRSHWERHSQGKWLWFRSVGRGPAVADCRPAVCRHLMGPQQLLEGHESPFYSGPLRLGLPCGEIRGGSSWPTPSAHTPGPQAGCTPKVLMTPSPCWAPLWFPWLNPTPAPQAAKKLRTACRLWPTCKAARAPQPWENPGP